MKKRNTKTDGSNECSAAVLYARVSSREQEREGYSIPAQIELLKQYAEENGLLIVREFIDVETAKQTGRPGFEEMVEFLKRAGHPTPALLTEKTDRLYRNIKDWLTVSELDAVVHLVKESEVLSRESHSNAKFVHGIKVLMAKQYCDNLSEETMKGMTQKAREGTYPSYAPTGYVNVSGRDGKKAIEIDPHTGPIVRRIFETYAAGTCSIEQIQELAHGLGLQGRGTGKPISRSTLHNILKNPFYRGRFVWNDVMYEGDHEPIVSPELWERVQEVRKGRCASSERRKKHSFTYSGLVRCGITDRLLVGDRKKQKYTYYSPARYEGPGKAPRVREETLEAQFLKVLEKLQIDDDVLELLVAALKESHVDERQFRAESVSRLQAEFTKLDHRLDALYTDKLDGNISPESYEKKKSLWRDEQQKLLRQIEAHKVANEKYIDDGVRLFELASKAHTLFKTLKPDEKRELLQLMCSNSTWTDDELEVEFVELFDLVMVTNEKCGKEKAAGGLSSGVCPEWLKEHS